MSRELAKVLEYEQLPEWPEDEISEMTDACEFNSKFNPERQQSQTINSEYTIKGKDRAQIGSIASILPASPSLEEFKDENLEVADESLELKYNLEGFDPINLVTLAGLYKDEMKYSGTGDNFNLKLELFCDNCRRFGIAPIELNLILAFSTMLKGKARRYWLESLDHKGYSFSEMIEVLRCHFSTIER